MPFYTYVLFSESSNRLYKGHCEDMELRLKQHNEGHTKSTKSFRPWKIVYYEVFEIREKAIAREKYFKTAAGRRFLKKTLNK